MTLYFVGADKEQLQMKIMNAGAIPTIVRLCASTHGDVQAEAADVLKVLSRNPAAGQVIVDAGETQPLAPPVRPFVMQGPHIMHC